MVYYACRKRDEGMALDDLRDWMENNKQNFCHWFTVDDLMFLKRGGRISATTALVGTMLQIKPVLHVDSEGHLISVAKARGRKAAIDALAKKVAELGEGFEKEAQLHAIYALLYGEVLRLCKEKAEAKTIKICIENFEKEFPNWRENPYLPYFGRAKNLFLRLCGLRFVAALRLLSWAHSKLVG
jgi:DegV family protein with EDD domain